MDLKGSQLNPFLLRSFGVIDGSIIGHCQNFGGCFWGCRWGFAGVYGGSIVPFDESDVGFAVEAEFNAHEMLDYAGVT